MRIRTIKPEFFTHEGLYQLEIGCGYPLRVAFSGLWGVADREGRFKWEPNRIKLSVLPYDALDFGDVLDVLAQAGFIKKYSNAGTLYGIIPSFKRHQCVNLREAASVCPSCEDEGSEMLHVSRTCTHMHAHEIPVQARVEGKGKEVEGTCGEQTDFFDDSPEPDIAPNPNDPSWTREGGWNIRDVDFQEWKQAYNLVNVANHIEQMDIWLRANPKKSHKKLWSRFITNWLSSQQTKASNLKRLKANNGEYKNSL